MERFFNESVEIYMNKMRNLTNKNLEKNQTEILELKNSVNKIF